MNARFWSWPALKSVFSSGQSRPSNDQSSASLESGNDAEERDRLLIPADDRAAPTSAAPSTRPTSASSSRIRAPKRRLSRKVTLSWLPRVLTFNFYTVHLTYIATLCLLGSFFIYLTEELPHDRPFTYVDALFTATSAACVTGLSSRDFSRMTLNTKIVSALMITLGSHTVMALVPIIVRRYTYRRTQGRGVGRLRRRQEEMTLQFEGRVANEAEYEALGLLQWIVIIYIAGVQFVSFIFMAVYVLARSDIWTKILAATPLGHSPLTVVFFHSIFAFHNAGLSMLEDSLVPIAGDRFLILTHALLISLGNVLFPVFLRIAVWIGRHWWDRNGQHKCAFRYLLRNPRRCSTHLFPSLQTRALLQIWLITNIIEFVAFLILDFSGPAMAGRSKSDRVLDGFFQSISTRTAGFNIAEISLFSPAMLILWLMLMYLSSYPFVLTMRQTARQQADHISATSTPMPSPVLQPQLTTKARLGHRASRVAVLSQSPLATYGSLRGSPQSLHSLRPSGLQNMSALNLPEAASASHRETSLTAPAGWSSEDEADDEQDEDVLHPVSTSQLRSPDVIPPLNTFTALLIPAASPSGAAASEVAGVFKGLLLRDVTWLYTAIFLICAIEGDRIRDGTDGLSVFGVMFEVVSGYGTVGLSVGVTHTTMSLSALFSPASKFIMAVIMLMGRHRGLPDALDTAVPEVDLSRPDSAIAETSMNSAPPSPSPSAPNFENGVSSSTFTIKPTEVPQVVVA